MIFFQMLESKNCSFTYIYIFVYFYSRKSSYSQNYI